MEFLVWESEKLWVIVYYEEYFFYDCVCLFLIDFNDVIIL